MSEVSEPIPIPLIGGRHLIFDVDVATYLRRKYHICGTTMGTLPQIPQQNLFLGLPIELMREEVRFLVEKNVAFVVNDTSWHRNLFLSKHSEDRNKYLDSLKALEMSISHSYQVEQRRRAKIAIARMASSKSINQGTSDGSLGCSLSIEVNEDRPISDKVPESIHDDFSEIVSKMNDIKSTAPCAVTPTVSYNSNSLLSCSYKEVLPEVPPSYAFYKYLHDRDYYILPGLRFGCNYNVYPGDPLRFHSHFIAVGFEWEQDMPIFDIIGGGRLATAVKKGFLIGGCDNSSTKEGDNIRTFSIEWGGM